MQNYTSTLAMLSFEHNKIWLLTYASYSSCYPFKSIYHTCYKFFVRSLEHHFDSSLMLIYCPFRCSTTSKNAYTNQSGKQCDIESMTVLLNMIRDYSLNSFMWVKLEFKVNAVHKVWCRETVSKCKKESNVFRIGYKRLLRETSKKKE